MLSCGPGFAGLYFPDGAATPIHAPVQALPVRGRPAGQAVDAARRQLLLKGPHRYSELVAELEVVTEGMLSQRLKELESAGVVQRRVIDDQPVRVEYHLTDKGRALGRVISGLERWAEEWIP